MDGAGGSGVKLPFLLEIGTEEIPDWMIPPAIKQLGELFQDVLDRRKLQGTISSTDATPRRLVLRAEGIEDRQPDSEELVLGPAKTAGEGAARGFAKKMGTTPDQLGTESTPKGEYFAFKKHLKGRAASDVLADELPQLILKLYFPKTMYWNGKGSERFIRPIRWLVALLGNAIVPFKIAGVEAGNITQGHRQLGTENIPVTTGNYAEELRRNFVELNFDQRLARIGSHGDLDLARTLAYMTEWPTPIEGSFDPDFLSLPAEVLTTVMRHHQRYFSVKDASGKLLPRFIAIMNTDSDPEGLVRRGNERVLRARFNDARFFWEQDQKKKLEDRVEDLKHVTFQAKLGSYYDKTQRTARLVGDLVRDRHAQRAALLCKCDLTTDMVKEFTDLQGVVGGLYAKAQGEPEEVWRAIYDHYKPLSMEDEIPSTESGRIVSLADKWDTLVSSFNVGLIPSGSRDPFALRRAAQGVVRIIVEGKVTFTFPGIIPQLSEFMRDRVETYFRDHRGFAYDEVRACMAAGWSDLLDLESRLKRVQAVRTTPDFEPIAASFKRIKNILQQAQFTAAGQLHANLVEPGPELDLYNEIKRSEGQPLESRIGPLRPKVDLFFDKVLVNAPDEAVRRNRLTLLHNLLTEFSEIADFSEIVTETKDQKN